MWDCGATRTCVIDQGVIVSAHARIKTRDSPLNFFNAHLSWVAEQNADNIVETIAYTRRFPGDSVLVGDFNAQAEGLTQLEEHGWVDAWKKLRRKDEGFTFEAGKPELPIDYAWVSEALVPQLDSIEIVADRQSANGSGASDRHGLLSRLD